MEKRRGARGGEKNKMTAQVKDWARLACELQKLRERFPAHAAAIERCIDETRRRLDSCGDPNCTCRLGRENFQPTTNPNVAAGE